MIDNEVDRIVNAVNALRPDWPKSSLRTFIDKHLRDRPRRDVAVALTWVACETQTTTPARVLEAGPWWHATNAEGTVTRRPPLLSEACPRHEAWHADGCPGCAADQLAGDTTAPRQATDRVDAHAWADKIRANLHGKTS